MIIIIVIIIFEKTSLVLTLVTDKGFLVVLSTIHSSVCIKLDSFKCEYWLGKSNSVNLRYF